MADVIFDNIAYEQSGQEDTDDGINQIQRVGTFDIEMVCQYLLNLIDEPFQQQTGKSCQYTYDKTDHQDEFSLAEVHATP